MGTFLDSTQVFDNEDVLREDYIPDTILERDEERETLINTLMSIAHGSQPSNCFIYGDAGVGKTVVVRSVLEELQQDMEQVDDVDVEVVWVNCKDRTSYKTAVALVNELRDEDNQISKTGYRKDDVHEMLWETINDMDVSHIIFGMDEIDSLGEDDDLLYQIPRALDNGHVEDTKLGIIGISNDFTFRDQLSPRVKSSLCEVEIRFGPYDANQLTTILEQRSDKAFLDGMLSDDVIPLTAALAGNDTGSARQALDILLQAGRIARQEDVDVVEEQHVRRGYDEVERNVVEDEIATLPTQGALVLYSLLQLQQQGETPVSKNDIYDLYKDLAEKAGKQVRTKRTVHDRLDSLSLRGFISVVDENLGERGGRRYRYEIDLDTDFVETIMTESHLDIIDPDENRTISDYQ